MRGRNERVDYVPRVSLQFDDRFPFVHSLDFNLILYSGFIRQWKNDSRDAFVNSLLPDRRVFEKIIYRDRETKGCEGTERHDMTFVARMIHYSVQIHKTARLRISL